MPRLSWGWQKGPPNQSRPVTKGLGRGAEVGIPGSVKRRNPTSEVPIWGRAKWGR